MAKQEQGASAPAMATVDYDHTAVRGSRDVNEQSETEPVVIEGTGRALTYARKLRHRWDDRQKKDGRIVWFCPFDPVKDRKLFETKAKCQAYMRKQYKASIELAKLEGKPQEAYTPQQTLLSPKRTLADMVLPEHAEFAAAAQKAAAKVQNLGQMRAAPPERR